MARKKRVGFVEATVLQNLALLAVFGFAWSKLGLGAAVKEIVPPPPPSCPVGEAPRFFLSQKTINGRSVGPGWVCLPVDVTRL